MSAAWAPVRSNPRSTATLRPKARRVCRVRAESLAADTALWVAPLRVGEIVLPCRTVVRSGQVHLPEQRLESGVGAKAREQERALDAVQPAGSLLIGSLQPIDRSVRLPKTRVDIRQVVG